MSYIFRTSTPNSISAIAGVRSVVCLWIVLFHILYYGLHYSESASLFLANSQGLLYQVIWSAVIYVDVFFALSAFLLVYNFLGNIELQNEIQGSNLGANVVLFGKHVLHRYVRLTPALLATILQTETVNQFMQTYSSFHISETRDFQCESSWWYNLLYIQNFLDMNMICGGWTWYLACDFQYFIVFLLLLFIFVKSKALGKLLFAIVGAIFIPLTFYTLFTNDFTVRFDAIFRTLNIVYAKFWCRMNPYIAGAFAGYLMRRIVKDDIKIKRIFAVFAWGCMGMLLLGSLGVSYWRDLPSWAYAIILAGGRVAIGIGTGVAIVLCHLGHGGWINTIFSHGAFQHTQKLTYTAYLLNPLVIFFLAGVKEKGVQVDIAEQAIFFLAVTIITYILAVINTLLFERPFQRLSDAFIMKRR
ncbi:O-acyltransferase like protein-like [Phlebotomus argentipes]|uniref:O-acyltransferase like protein-like n=1 Tax=Phlebotomus argentipes TaxID=94469 RepID=UPI002892EBBE|nr:O-acyltransferase like protein-like [Phlebotomus argentipes]